MFLATLHKLYCSIINGYFFPLRLFRSYRLITTVGWGEIFDEVFGKSFSHLQRNQIGSTQRQKVIFTSYFALFFYSYSNAHLRDGANNVSEIMCSVCFEDNQDQITALACNHYFCNGILLFSLLFRALTWLLIGCWKNHIDVAIKDGRAVDISCMQLKCKELMPDYIVRKIVVCLDNQQEQNTFLCKILYLQ